MFIKLEPINKIQKRINKIDNIMYLYKMHQFAFRNIDLDE
jgi:hypothetical protein